MPFNLLSSPDLDSLAPTPGTMNKKAKSRLMDKEGRNRNRLSHTSAPLYFAKTKRPVPTDVDGVGATNRLPGGQQPAPRRQRSLHSKGESTNTDQTLQPYSHTEYVKCFVWLQQTKLDPIMYGRKRQVLLLTMQLWFLSQEEGRLRLWQVYISWRRTKKSQPKLVKHPKVAGIFSFFLSLIDIVQMKKMSW